MRRQSSSTNSTRSSSPSAAVRARASTSCSCETFHARTRAPCAPAMCRASAPQPQPASKSAHAGRELELVADVFQLGPLRGFERCVGRGKRRRCRRDPRPATGGRSRSPDRSWCWAFLRAARIPAPEPCASTMHAPHLPSAAATAPATASTSSGMSPSTRRSPSTYPSPNPRSGSHARRQRAPRDAR